MKTWMLASILLHASNMEPADAIDTHCTTSHVSIFLQCVAETLTPIELRQLQRAAPDVQSIAAINPGVVFYMTYGEEAGL